MRPNSENSSNPDSHDRRDFLAAGLAAGLLATTATVPAHAADRSFELDELTIADLQDGMKSGKYTARALTEKYLSRIDAIDRQGPALNSVIEANPDALA